MLGRILCALFGRLTVTDRALARAPDQLIGFLAEQRFANPERITRAARESIVQEAHRVALAKESDGIARMAPFIDELEKSAAEVAAAFRGEDGYNPRIRSILVFHKLLDE